MKFLVAEVEPVFQYCTGETSYRAACYLKDGAYFPCVEFKSTDELVYRAVRRLDEARDGKISYDYPSVLKSFLTIHNCIHSFHIKSVEHSPYAIPNHHRDILYKAADALKVELTWDSMPFVAEMKDGNRFAYWFEEKAEFFEMPVGYNANQINSVFPNRKLKTQTYSSKISFDCYIDCLI